MVADNLGYVGPTSPMLGRPLFPNVSTTQPYNFRNGVSMLQLIEQLSQAGRELQDEWADYQLSAKEWADGLDDAWDQFQHQYAHDFQELRDELVQLIQQAASDGNILVWSPAYGNYVPLQNALNDIYDADRYHGLFPKDFDDLELSPAVFDSIGVSPRKFDLDSTGKTNSIQGMVSAEDITWLHPEQQEMTPSQQELAKVFLVRNPDATTFSNGN